MIECFIMIEEKVKFNKDMSKSPLEGIIVNGDKVLIKPQESEKLDSGIFVPNSYHLKAQIGRGYVMKHGPGFGVPNFKHKEEYETTTQEYIQLQVREGDLAIYIKSEAIEVEYKKEIYHIVSDKSILMMQRIDY